LTERTQRSAGAIVASDEQTGDLCDPVAVWQQGCSRIGGGASSLSSAKIRHALLDVDRRIVLAENQDHGAGMLRRSLVMSRLPSLSVAIAVHISAWRRIRNA
jgi:hypothetical protein